MRIALFAILLAGCGGARSPAGAVRALCEAANEADRDGVRALLGPASRARLAADAALAARAGGRARPDADLLAVGWFPTAYAFTDVREVERRGDDAWVETRGSHGEHDRVHCVRVDGAWRVELW
jgi:hypothetical protein